METDVLDSIPENENERLTDQEIFTTIWTSPRRVFKFINDNHYDKYNLILLSLAGLSRAFDRAVMKNLGDTMSLSGVIATCVIGGAVFGWISYYLYAALINWTGGWLNGKGNTKSIVTALAYGMLPLIVALALLIPQIVVYGNEMFKSDGDIISGGWLSNVIVYGSLALEFILAVISIVLTVVGISEVQKLSIGKSILNLVLPFFVVFVPIFLIILLAQGF